MVWHGYAIIFRAPRAWLGPTNHLWTHNHLLLDDLLPGLYSRLYRAPIEMPGDFLGVLSTLIPMV